MRNGLIALLAAALVTTTGCGAVLDAAMKSAGNQVGGAIGNQVGKQVGTVAAGYTSNMMHNLSPALMQAYSMALFSLLYHHGGYHFAGLRTADYQPGHYTRWTAPDAKEGDWFEKAYLKHEEDGKQWWRVHAKGKDDNGKAQEVILEALFDKQDKSGARKILRMRAKLPNRPEAEEIPITEQNQASWVLRPSAQVSEESLKGATVGTESVTVPAGTFKARHIKYAGTNGANEWWVAGKSVPGGFVQYAIEGQQRNKDTGKTEPKRVVVQLLEHGKGDGASKLGAF